MNDFGIPIDAITEIARRPAVDRDTQNPPKPRQDSAAPMGRAPVRDGRFLVAHRRRRAGRMGILFAAAKR